MTIWKQHFDLESLNLTSKDTAMECLGIKYSDFDDNSLSATMPVDARTHQPLGMLHGGASVLLAESLGSIAANMCVDDSHFCVGLDINANHIKAVRSGIVTGTATPVHLGVKTQVWQIEIRNSSSHLICTSRLTIAVMKRKAK
ncbi:hotdog fold thioesterase [Aliivibrio kagoshimensis]|uniref:hotdog fold thioesterase n=1 Tax=Aliivibrio kagoshimensis TaxID=2910230 RepID=UPI003D0A97AB